MPTSFTEDFLFNKDEDETSATILKKAAKRSLQTAGLERELEAISQRMMVPCYNERLRKTEPFAHPFLRDLLDVKKLANEDDKFRLELDRGLLNILVQLRKTAQISAGFVEKTSIDLVLRRVGDGRWGFSVIARVFAEGLYQRFEQQNWGNKPNQPHALAGPPEEPKEKRKHARSSSMAKSMKEQKLKARVDEIHIKKPIPDDNDPTFGITGPMRGTLIKYNTIDPQKASKSIVLNPGVQQVDCKVWGHNGIAIGQIYLRQMAALAQGAHGSSQAGISGSAEDGAYSVIVTGTYKSLEKDGLEHFEYCASGSMDNTFRDSLIESQGLKALRVSKATAKPVRVLRGQNEDFQYAPKFGLRYDGLYKVVEEKRRHNSKGGLYAVFVLERMGQQAPVNLGRPNAKDFEQLAALKRMLE